MCKGNVEVLQQIGDLVRSAIKTLQSFYTFVPHLQLCYKNSDKFIPTLGIMEIKHITSVSNNSRER